MQTYHLNYWLCLAPLHKVIHLVYSSFQAYCSLEGHSEVRTPSFLETCCGNQASWTMDQRWAFIQICLCLQIKKYLWKTNLLCIELLGGCCMAAGSWGFLFMTGGGHIPDTTWGGMLAMLGGMFGPMLGPIFGPILGPYGRAPIWFGGILPGGMPLYGDPAPCPAIGFIGPIPTPG